MDLMKKFKALCDRKLAPLCFLLNSQKKTNLGGSPRVEKFSARRGQVAVIMIVAIAIGIVLFAASINLTMVSQSKTFTMKAASSSASLMASTIASYGQKQWVETLGSRSPAEYCKKSSGGLIALIVLIILIVIAVYTGYVDPTAFGTAASTSAVSVSATIGAVMQGMSIIVAASTDPGISEAWNKMQEANLSTTGQFVERGVLLALQGAVTDSVKIPDLYDQDADGNYGYPGNNQALPPNDEIGRFSHYITKRYLELGGPDTAAVRAFIDALHELTMLPGVDNFALFDPVHYPDGKTRNTETAHNANHLCYEPYFIPATTNLNPGYTNRPAECDPCCRQSETPIEGCDASAGDAQLGNRATCSQRSPFRIAGNVYQYVYYPAFEDLTGGDFTALYEDSTNNFMSLREQLGRDDEHQRYQVVQAVPNWHEDPVTEPQNLIIAPSPTGFFLRDVVGYYTGTGYPANTDRWVLPKPLFFGNDPATPRLYPFLYKMRDWGPDLSAATYANYECHLCDAGSGIICPADASPEIGRLALPFDPVGVPYNNTQGWCVNKNNKGGVDDPPVVPDSVRNLLAVPGIPQIFVPTPNCAMPSQSPASDISKYIGGWKAGADRYCSNAADTDYNMYCPKNSGNPEAICPNGPFNSADWPDDILDEIIYGDMPHFFNFERTLFKSASTPEGLKQLAKELETWYGEVPPGGTRAADGMADWIEPPCLNPTNCPGSYTKLARPGRLYVWREQFRAMRQVINEWLIPPGNATNPKYVSPTCLGSEASWCVQSATCPGMPLVPPVGGEAETFDFNGNGQRGDVADVMACLNWNTNNVFTYPDFSTATGNAQKFQKCFADCNSGNCSNLPRSLFPDFYTHLPLQFYPGDETKINDCLNSLDIGTCSARCAIVPTASPYSIAPPFIPPNNARLLDIAAWCGGGGAGGAPLNNACNFAAPLICNGNPGANQTSCRCSWANDCTLSLECARTSCAVANSFCDQVTLALPISKGSCGNAQSVAFKITLQQSATEASVQVEKFRQRYKFLKGRFDEATSIVNSLTIAINSLSAFLDNNTPNNLGDSPAERFIQNRLAPIQNTTRDLPSFAIYVWQDKDPILTNPAGQPRWGTGQGYWHAVKAEVRIPRRCAGNCLNNDWPKIDSRTSGGFLSKKVCYKLINREGMTKARVIRYDQDKDMTGLMFPGGGQIWKPRLSNPTFSTDPNPGGLRADCAALIDNDLAGWLGGADDRRHLGAAFMLNKIPNLGNPADPYTVCWNRVHNQLLSHGIMSESCAQYYFVEGQGFRVKFVPCDNW